ncbi:hypothetical protein F4804DRAFT_297672 [Jackrogersella minutella]|nr:hypothetical protein F4804DRAFT_297672 [Jackrogersella minutella]
MHSSACPKCGTTFDGDSKKCNYCGAVSLLLLLNPAPPNHRLLNFMYISHTYILMLIVPHSQPPLLSLFFL